MLLVFQLEDAPFCSAAYCSAYMAYGCRVCSSREYEAGERRKCCIYLVYGLLQSGYVCSLNEAVVREGGLTLVGSQISPYGEEFVLYVG